VDALARDVRTKQAAQRTRQQQQQQREEDCQDEHGAADYYDDPVSDSIVDDDTKKKLAIRSSAAMSRPGAFDEQDQQRQQRPKPSQARIREMGGMRHIQKGRQYHQDNEHNEPSRVEDIHAKVVLDDMQYQMNTFIDETNKQVTDEAEKEQIKQRRRKIRWLLICIVELIAIIVVIVGIVIGTGGGGNSSAKIPTDEADVAPFNAPRPTPLDIGVACVDVIETALSERYHALRSMIVSDYPSMDESLATMSSHARESLCWLAYVDQFDGVPVSLGGNSYQVIQRFTLTLIFYHFVYTKDRTEVNEVLYDSNWRSDTHECQWDFLVCDEEATVSKIVFRTKGLEGRVPRNWRYSQSSYTLTWPSIP
jgi:hypothetical protein